MSGYIKMKAPLKGSSVAVFTVSTCNYYHFSKTLMSSLARFGLDIQLFVVIVDSGYDSLLYESDEFEVIPVEKLRLPLGKRFFFQYNAMEACAAIKSFGFDYLFTQGFEKVIYFDNDIYVYSSIKRIIDSLDGHDGIFVPHITKPLKDNFIPDELTIIRGGVFNTGFLALRATDQSFQFVDWWKRKVEHQCLIDIPAGMLVVQKWLDLIPSFFPAFYLNRSEGLDVAYWNLHERKITYRDGVYYANESPLVFFHFSGFDPSNPGVVSIHDRRFLLEGLSQPVRKLHDDYVSILKENGLDSYKNEPYSFDYFTDTEVYIPQIVRNIYRNYHDIQELFGDDPFDISKDPDFARSYNRKPFGETLSVTLLSQELHRQNDSIRVKFPDISGASAEPYSQWFAEQGKSFGLSEIFLTPIITVFESKSKPLPKISDSWPHRLMRDVLSTACKVMASIISGNQWLDNRSPLSSGIIGLSLLKIAKASRKILRYLWQNYVDDTSKTFLAASLEQKLLSKSGNRHERRFDSHLMNSNNSGINVIGWFTAESGLGESARSTLRAASAADIPVRAVSFTADCMSRMQERLPNQPVADIPADGFVNLFHVNIDHFLSSYKAPWLDKFKSGYVVAYWVWETQYLPKYLEPPLALVDEIWTPSSFCQGVFSRRSRVPVIKIPHCVELETSDKITRADLALPEDKFIFLAMADFLSTPERKNPLGALEAFLRAFGQNPEGVAMVLKISNGYLRPDVMEQIRTIIDRSSAALLLDGYLERPYVNSLISNCDCYVSLHRAEGFGLPIAEAMYLGKPVIATGWSGNMDFMNINNSLPVNYALVELDNDCMHYPKGSVWADPDLDHAAEQMQKVVNDTNWGTSIGLNAAREMRNNFSAKSVGHFMVDRLQAIGLFD
jgi:glycosyltransferase involved in cell wall biosynthesis